MEPEHHVVARQVLNPCEAQRKPKVADAVEGHHDRENLTAHRARQDLHNHSPGDCPVAAHVAHNQDQQRRQRQPGETADDMSVDLLEVKVEA